MFGPRAFSFALEEDREVHVLVGHSFDKPLASRRAGTLNLTDTDAALVMEAELTPEIQAATWVQDFLAGLRAGLIVGLSPGFRGSGFTAAVISAREADISGRRGIAELTGSAQGCVSLWEGGMALADVSGTDTRWTGARLRSVRALWRCAARRCS